MPKRTMLSVTMKLRFNPVERMAGAFILFAVFGTLISGSAVLVRKGFFDKTVPFKTVIPSSESIYSGMPVLMSGVRVGRVDEIDLDRDGGAEVRFTVRSKYAARVKADSHVSITRQSWLGEKIFDLSTGSRDSAPAVAGQEIEMHASGDIGAKAGHLMENVDRLVTELTEVASQLSRKKNTEALLGNLRQTSEAVAQMSTSFPQMGKDVAAITAQLNVLSEQLARKSPDGNTRLAQILEETSVLVRALQKNFLIRGSVATVREEEQKRLAEKQEKPAAVPTAPTGGATRVPAGSQ